VILFLLLMNLRLSYKVFFFTLFEDLSLFS
jgi:hypothetical protein